MSSEVISVSILVRSSSSDVSGTKHRVYIAKDATLAELRTVLEEDEIMAVGDKFFDKGYSVGKSSESRCKWADTINSKDGHVQVLSSNKATTNGDGDSQKNMAIPKHVSRPEGYTPASGKATMPNGHDDDVLAAKTALLGNGDFDFGDPKGVHELSDEEKEMLSKYAGLGLGINISSDKGPNRSGHQVLDRVELSDLDFVDCERGQDDIVISYSARASAYARSGWAEAAISAETPFVSGSLEVSAQAASRQSQSSSTLYITGRYLYALCQITLPLDVKPHPSFKKAVDAALNRQDPAVRTAELGKVFSTFGHMYVVSVEMGGMKHVTQEKRTEKKEDESSFGVEMKLAISKKFGPGQAGGSVGGGYNQEQQNTSESSFESMTFDTVGGVIYGNNIDKWKASLFNSANWRVTRTMRVESVIGLFDDETQAKIIAAAPSFAPKIEAPPELPKGPLYRLYNPSSGDHFYTADAAERDRAKAHSGYSDEGTQGSLLHSQAESSTPLYRLWNGKDHFYTTDAAERDRATSSIGYSNEGTAGFVYTTEKAGTTALYRLFNPGSGDHFYTTNAQERDNASRGGWNIEGTACYVFA